jgi:hypothetical protein
MNAKSITLNIGLLVLQVLLDLLSILPAASVQGTSESLTFAAVASLSAIFVGGFGVYRHRGKVLMFFHMVLLIPPALILSIVVQEFSYHGFNLFR